MKKIINQDKIKKMFIVTIACVSITAFAGCTSNKTKQTEEAPPTKSTQETEPISLTEDKEPITNVFEFPVPELGVELNIPGIEYEAMTFDITPVFENPYDPNAKALVNISLNSPELMEYMNTLTEEDMKDEVKMDAAYKKMESFTLTVLIVERFKDDVKSAKELTGVDNAEEIRRENGFVYVIYEPEVDLNKLDDKLKALYEEQKDNISKIRKEIKLIPVEEMNTEVLGSLPNFSSTTLKGDKVTQDIFKGKKVTMINFWGTFCGPCIEEMPDLGELAKELPEGTQLVGVVVDIVDGQNIKLAKQILEKANAEFTNIIPDQALLDYAENLAGVPSTIFVDENGKMIGSVLGSKSKEEYSKDIQELMR